MNRSSVWNGMRACIICRAHKPISEFYSYAYTTGSGNRSVRYESRCKPCARDRRVAQHAKDPERGRANSRAWRTRNGDAGRQSLRVYRAAHPEKVRAQRVVAQQKRRAKSNLSPAENRVLIDRVLDDARFGDLYLDAYSGSLIVKPEIDHIKALKRGGTHEYDNLCVTSGANNRSKNAARFLIWMCR